MRKKVPPRTLWQYKKANYDQLRDELNNYRDEFALLESSGTEALWTSSFKMKLLALMRAHIPQNSISGDKNNKMDNQGSQGSSKEKR
ncbi:hypothetical protein ACJMK2_007464 [Sinanodonta woodiana]|uniref:Transposase n=1 Tax=Sinanodonta woodiana TaxID=1069815 RepID=A0ABD3VLT4_SINWO